MKIEIAPVNSSAFGQLEKAAGSTTCWELEWEDNHRPRQCEDGAFDKQLWIQRVLMEWGTCGFTALVSTGESDAKSIPAATVFFAPSGYFPGYAVMPSGPISPDAVVMSHVYVTAAYMGLYLEHQIIEAVVAEARKRGIKAIETFARAEDEEDLIEKALQLDIDGYLRAHDKKNPVEGAVRATQPLENQQYFFDEAYGGWHELVLNDHSEQRMDHLSVSPVISEDIVRDQGFTLIQKHAKYPRYRYDIGEAASMFAVGFNEDKQGLGTAVSPWPTVIGGKKKYPAHAKSLSSALRKKLKGEAEQI